MAALYLYSFRMPLAIRGRGLPDTST